MKTITLHDFYGYIPETEDTLNNYHLIVNKSDIADCVVGESVYVHVPKHNRTVTCIVASESSLSNCKP